METQEIIAAWADATFPNSTRESIARHLLSEAMELCLSLGVPMNDIEAIAMDAHERHGQHVPMPKMEIASIAVLCYHFAHKEHTRLGELVNSIMVINRTREWAKTINWLGFTDHVRPRLQQR